MARPLTGAQIERIRSVLRQLDLGRAGRVMALDTWVGERVAKEGELDPKHRECAREGSPHRAPSRDTAWACERHGLFGRAAIAGDRVALVWVNSEGHGEERLQALRGAAHRIGQILEGSTGGAGPAPAHVYAGIAGARFDELLN